MKHEFRQRQNMIEMITINLMNELNLNAFCQEKNTTGITCMILGKGQTQNSKIGES